MINDNGVMFNADNSVAIDVRTEIHYLTIDDGAVPLAGMYYGLQFYFPAGIISHSV